MFLIDEGSQGQEETAYDLMDSIHIHGYSFYVIAMERHGIMNENTMITNYYPPKGNKALINMKTC